MRGAANFQGNKFLNGIQTDTIAESTSGSGVTVDGCLIKDGAAAAANSLSASGIYQASSTGTGSEQSIAHGLGSTPALVVAIPTAGHDGSGSPGTSAGTVSYGTHTSTHIKVTVTEGCTFRVVAIK
jgi:hypothetical protein